MSQIIDGKEYDKNKSIMAQSNYCKEKELPYFAPNDGRCYQCNMQIYEPIEHGYKDRKTGEIIGKYVTGVSVKEASTELITGCPHCCYSYCE